MVQRNLIIHTHYKRFWYLYICIAHIRRRVAYVKTMDFFNQRYLWKLKFDRSVLHVCEKRKLQPLHCYEEDVNQTSNLRDNVE